MSDEDSKKGPPCQNCGSPRREDGLAFCEKCGLPYPNWADSSTTLRPPPTLLHPWFVFVALGILVGAAGALVAKDVTVSLLSFTSHERLLAMAFWIGLWSVYWLPTIVAVFRRRMPVWPVALINLLLGLSIGGWFIALWLAGRGRIYGDFGKASRLSIRG